MRLGVEGYCRVELRKGEENMTNNCDIIAWNSVLLKGGNRYAYSKFDKRKSQSFYQEKRKKERLTERLSVPVMAFQSRVYI